MRCSVCGQNNIWNKQLTGKFCGIAVSVSGNIIGGNGEYNFEYNFCSRRKCQRIMMGYTPRKELHNRKFQPYPVEKLNPFPLSDVAECCEDCNPSLLKGDK